MKLKLIIVLMTVIFGSCQQCNKHEIKAKTVEVDGLGSLQSLKDRQLNEKQLTKVIKTVVKRNIVNEEDANAMLEIYKKYGNVFLNAPAFAYDKEKLLAKDIESYLTLMLAHESLRDEVHLTTQQIITQDIKRSVKFETDVTSSSIGENIGTFAGGYVNAYNKAISKDSQNRRDASGKQQAENKFNIINGFEQAAFEKMSESEKITDEEKENIKQFQANLKSYNESLPENAKILDANGRLINPAQMTDRQKDSMEDIFSNETNKAGQNLNERMRPIYTELRVATQQQVEK